MFPAWPYYKVSQQSTASGAAQNSRHTHKERENTVFIEKLKSLERGFFFFFQVIFCLHLVQSAGLTALTPKGLLP